MWEEEVISWKQVVTGLSSLLGVIIGGLTTYHTQYRIEEKRIQREERKDLETRKIEKFKIYSKILKIDGEVLTHMHLGQRYMEFYLETFREKFRSVIYSQLYLLDQDIVDIIRKMDEIFIKIEIREESTDVGIKSKEHDELFDLYNSLIYKVEYRLKEY